jgi:Fe-S cluster biogenesis protein NfuA/rhodanese-related sulfurtransferase
MSGQEEKISLSRQPEMQGGPATAPAASVPEAATPAQTAGAAVDTSANQLKAEQFLERRRTSQSVYVFDLRPSEAYDAEHLPGAYSLPFGHLEANLHRLPFSGDLLLYDGGEGTGRQAAALLIDNGFSDFWYLEEGYDALMDALRASPAEVHYEALTPEERAAKIDQVLNEKVREFLARDGGGLEVMGIEESKVVVSYQGACGSCSSSTAGTLRFIQGALTINMNHEIEVVPVET